MKASLSWLKEWVALDGEVAALAERLTMAGIEVEGRAAAAPPFAGVVVGEILEARRHPQAERLTLCTVDDGSGARLTIVCGAPNARQGLKSPLARVGATLPGGVVIRRAALRGVESEGMLCSARELGLGEDSDGILELDAGLAPGSDLRAALDLDDTVLEVNPTPNRGDALSILGLAREFAVITGRSLTGPPMAAVPARIRDTVPVALGAPDGCPKFAGRVVRGVDPTRPTPLWMRERLRRAGLRSLGPLVDVTNYVMLELGQPMHAYDLRRLSGTVTARRARAGEPLKLLDGSEIALGDDMLVIADDNGPVGLAGIMGGERSGIAADTTDVFLEAAFFAPAAVAGRGRRLGVLTDASQRFERGVDPEGAERAIERATELLTRIAGGSAGPTQVAVERQRLPVARPIELRRAQLKRLLASDIPDARVPVILTALGLAVAARRDGWAATPPSWRFDLVQEADLVEEVARIHGYNAIPEVDAPMPQRPGAVPEGRVSGERLALALVDRGYHEAINYTFVDPSLQRRLFPAARALTLTNPISAELAEMRVSLWPSLLATLGSNARRQQTRIRLFEIGAKFVLQDDVLKEINAVGGVAFGDRLPEQWGAARERIDFYDVKADVEAILAATGQLARFSFRAEALECLHPGRCARIFRDSVACGWIGELHPELARTLEFPSFPVLFELELDISSRAPVPAATELSRFPTVRRDLAVVVNEAVTFSQLRESVTVAASSLMRELKVFDVYRGRGIDSGRKSVALGLILQDKSKTLTDVEVDAVMNAVRERLAGDLGATIRD